MSKFKAISSTFKEDEIREILQELGSDTSTDVEFEEFLKVINVETTMNVILMDGFGFDHIYIMICTDISQLTR